MRKEAMNLQKLSNIVINFFLVLLIGISLFGAVSLIVTSFEGIGKVSVSIADLGIVILIFYMISESFRGKLIKSYANVHDHIQKNIGRYKLILLCLTIFWQLFVVVTLSGFSQWDPSIISFAAMHRKFWVADYFSINSNTTLLLFIENLVWIITGKLKFGYFVIVLNLINMLLIDFGICFVFKSANYWFSRRQAIIGLKLSWLLIAVSPWVAIPYSDTWGFFLTTLVIWIGICYTKSVRLKYKIAYASLLGFTFTFSYLMKPSLIIVFIAFFIVMALRKVFSSKKIVQRNTSLSLVPFILFIGISYGCFHLYTVHQTIVYIENGRTQPITHFIAMGMQGSGGYNLKDVEMNTKIKSPAKRNAANVKLIKKRYRDFNGMTNYQKFLVRKQINNTADGTFGWGKEGIFLIANKRDNDLMNKLLPRKLFTNHGVADGSQSLYNFFAQIVWCFCLFFILWTIKDATWKVQFIKYSIVGFFMFLLIFEGGRSRYVIQFLPLLIMLSSVGYINFKDWLNNRKKFPKVD